MAGNRLKLCAIFFILLCEVVGCRHKMKSGNDLSDADLQYIQSLGLLQKNEHIISFDTQGGGFNPVKTSGNFYTDKRIAANWTDNKKADVNFAYYKDIDSITTKDLSPSLTSASYAVIYTNDDKQFKVYVDGDSLKVNRLFKAINANWLKGNSAK